jgi:hypothetical protein
LKLIRLSFVFAFAILCLTFFPATLRTTNAAYLQEGHGHGGKHGAGVRQYDEFHDVLHPLQHEALPNKDFKLIRAKSALLESRGRAIVRLGVPRGTKQENRTEFSRELKKFSKALTKYRTDARRGTDAQLEASYSAVHDSFEMLTAMLPRS